jgi:endonuclease/exonuclease/phosphatase family metal-dependent hydrolase
MRLVTLNLNHRTRQSAVPYAIVEGLLDLAPDVVVLTEYVEPEPCAEIRASLRRLGLDHVAVSSPIEYRRGRWSNQVLIASRWPTSAAAPPDGPPDESAQSNILRVMTGGIDVVGLRVPAYTAAGDWYRYWRWLQGVIGGDLVIGDLNVDPARSDRRARVLASLMEAGAWMRIEPMGSWSYMGRGGRTSRIDHVLFRGPVRATAARYVPEPFVPLHTDHAALVAEIDAGPSGAGTEG